MIQREQDTREEAVLQVAKEMMTAARTAPKARGIDNIEICVVRPPMMLRLCTKMRTLGKLTDLPFFLRDAENVENSVCVVLIGARETDFGLDIKIPPMDMDENWVAEDAPELPYDFGSINLGIAVGAAVSVAADRRVDNRVMFSAGVAARELNLLPGCGPILAIPLSCGGKNPYFDRQ